VISFFITIVIVIACSVAARYGIFSLVDKGILEYTIIPGVLDYTYVRNTGAAFGMFSGKKYLLIAITSIIIIAIVIYVIYNRKTINKWEKLALALMISGGFCNMYERCINDSVLDYINTHLLPVFNVADIAVTIGSILLFIYILIIEPKHKNEREHN